MRRRFFTLVLALVMAAALLPTTAGAAEPTSMADPTLSGSAAYTTNNPYTKKSKGECVWYAWGRYKELCGVELPTFGSAKDWLAKAQAAKYPTGSTPKVGAIACWTADVWDTTNHVNGHVAVVEWVDKNTNDIRISQYNRGVRFGGGKKFGGMNGNQWQANYLEKVTGKGFPPRPSGYIYLMEPEKKVTVTFDANGGTPTTEKTYAFETNTTFGTLPTPTRTGYTFGEWTYSSSAPEDYVPESSVASLYIGETTKISTIYDGNGDHITLYATWWPCRYTVSFNANGGSVSTSSQRIYYNWPYNFKGALPTPTRAGYTFDGWYTAANGGTKIAGETTVKTTKDQTLYAHWTKVVCTTHTWGDWSITKTVSCGVAGSRTHKCTTCGKAESETIPALTHDYQLTSSTATAKFFTCANCGDSYSQSTLSWVEVGNNVTGTWSIGLRNFGEQDIPCFFLIASYEQEGGRLVALQQKTLHISASSSDIMGTDIPLAKGPLTYKVFALDSETLAPLLSPLEH